MNRVALFVGGGGVSVLARVKHVGTTRQDWILRGGLGGAKYL